MGRVTAKGSHAADVRDSEQKDGLGGKIGKRKSRAFWGEGFFGERGTLRESPRTAA